MRSRVTLSNNGERAIRELERLGKRLRGPDSVRVGLPSNSNNYPDGTSVIMVGAVHEFGSPSRGIPERSYLRSTVIENSLAYKRVIKKLAKKVVDGKITKKEALSTLGLLVATDVKDKITDIKSPPLKHREGNPLVDTGHLRRAITFQVGD